MFTFLRYGTANQAFDPDVENDPNAMRRLPGGNIFTGKSINIKCFKLLDINQW